jgi:mannose-6-phosphate isomerase-like protein (cupin superfamily)
LTADARADGVEHDAPGCRVVRAGASRAFMEGDEACREYVRTPSFWMGTSRLPPGAAGDRDPGHADHAEMFLVVSGSARISTGHAIYELDEGDALFIPPTIPHTLRNDGAAEAVLVWAAGLSREP